MLSLIDVCDMIVKIPLQYNSLHVTCSLCTWFDSLAEVQEIGDWCLLCLTARTFSLSRTVLLLSKYENSLQGQRLTVSYYPNPNTCFAHHTWCASNLITITEQLYLYSQKVCNTKLKFSFYHSIFCIGNAVIMLTCLYA